MTNGITAGSAEQSDAATHWANAISSFGNGEMHEAIAFCQKLLELEPEHFDAVQLIGKAAKQLGQLAHAEKFFRAALAMRPDSVDTLNELGAILIPLGQAEQSLEYFMRAMELRPDSSQAWQALRSGTSERSRGISNRGCA